MVVASESFGAEFSRLHGSKRDWTPKFDACARKELWFANTYASGTFATEPDVQNLLPLGVAYFQTAADLFKSHSYE